MYCTLLILHCRVQHPSGEGIRSKLHICLYSAICSKSHAEFEGELVVENSESEGRSQAASNIHEMANRVRTNVGQVIVGSDDSVTLVIVALLARGHVLLEDVPGTGKTTLAKTLARSIGANFGRIQFTPDLMPSDVLGINYFSQKSGEFEFREGPIATNILLADEINRATPRTQSALLEAMQEYTFTIDGNTRELTQPFIVLATQNPVELEGTFPLPEAQLDRFMLRTKIGYPDEDGEVEVLNRFRGRTPFDDLGAVVSANELIELSESLMLIHIEDEITRYVVRVCRATREHPACELGASPRASLALLECARALAAIEGRDYVRPDDVKSLVQSVLSHRLLLSSQTRLRGRTTDDVLDEIIRELPVPIID